MVLLNRVAGPGRLFVLRRFVVIRLLTRLIVWLADEHAKQGPPSQGACVGGLHPIGLFPLGVIPRILGRKRFHLVTVSRSTPVSSRAPAIVVDFFAALMLSRDAMSEVKNFSSG